MSSPHFVGVMLKLLGAYALAKLLGFGLITALLIYMFIRWTWLTWLLVVLLVATFAALTGIKPKGSRPVAHTRLMGVARVVLVVGVLILAYMALRARSGG